MKANHVNSNLKVSVPRADASINGQTPSIFQVSDSVIDIPVCVATLSGQVMVPKPKLSVDLATMVLSGLAPSEVDSGINVPVGAMTLNGLTALLNDSILMPAGILTGAAIDVSAIGVPDSLINVPVCNADLNAQPFNVNMSINTAVAQSTFDPLAATLINILSVQLGMATFNGLTPSMSYQLDIAAGILAATNPGVSVNQLYNPPVTNMALSGPAIVNNESLSVPVGAGVLSVPTITPSVPGGSTVSQLFFSTFAQTGGGTKDVLIFLPANYTPTKSYPVCFFYHGDGAKGTVTNVTNQSVGTGNGLQVTFTGNFTNSTSVLDVSPTEVIFKVGGVEKGRGKRDGTVSGSGVTTGSIAFTATNGAFSVTFSVAPSLGAAVTVDYKYSALIGDTGYPTFLIQGDEPTDIIFMCPQINVTSFDLVKDYDDLVTFANDNYSINLNRIYVTGLSRGGFQVRALLQGRYADGVVAGTYGIAAYVNISCGYNSGYTWSNYSNIGGWWHHGTADTNQTYSLASVLNSQIGLVNIPHETTGYWGKDHEAYVWDTMVYNRLHRTDTTGTAFFDFIDFLKMFSKDQTERATLHVEAAESQLHLNIYRRALVQVNALSAGSTKTALLARLATVKTTIGTVYTIDWGIAANLSGGNINDITTGATNGALSNIIDDAGGASGIGIKIDSQLTTAGTKTAAQTRCNGAFKGLPANFNIDAASALTTVTTGQVEFNNLPSNTYKILFHVFSGNTTATEALIAITINGVTKTMQSEHNSYYCIEFSGLTRDGSNKIIIGITAPGAANGRVTGFDLIKT